MNKALLIPLSLVLALGPVAASTAAPPSPIVAAVADAARAPANRAMDEARMPAAVLAFAGIRPGEIVADYQAGGGYYTELIADLVGPRGRVYAMSQPNFWEAETWQPLLRAHRNVAPLIAPAAALQLAPESVDTIFAHLVYHDLYWTSDKYEHPRMDVDAVVRGWFAAVRPGGHVVIVDHAASPGSDPRESVEKFHRIDPAVVRADMERAGFVFDSESATLHRSEDGHEVSVFDPSIRGKTDRFMLRFRKPS